MQVQELLPAHGVEVARKPGRLESIDLLRGIVMVVMALDHTRDFFGINPWGMAENARAASPALFFTRWITHFCAPTFVFLAGVSAFLSHRENEPKERLAGFLCVRGVLLVLLELTLVKFGWSWQWPMTGFTMLQVIWAIGWSMILLSFLIWLPAWFIGLLGAAIVFGHNLLDGMTGPKLMSVDLGLAKYLGIKADWPAFLGERGWLYDLLFVHGRFFAQGKAGYFNLYPIIPWFGVMAAGYGLGAVFRWEPKQRRSFLLFLGSLLLALFITLRYQNAYGDPKTWQSLPEFYRTVMSFLNCTKYPPSLLFVLMTLGPSLIALALFDALLEYRSLTPVSNPERTFAVRLYQGCVNLLAGFFLVFGRVPLFFYLLHLPLIHGLAKWTAHYLEQKPSAFSMSPLSKGFELPTMYAVWVGIVLLLFLPCLGYGWCKKRIGGILRLL